MSYLLIKNTDVYLTHLRHDWIAIYVINRFFIYIFKTGLMFKKFDALIQVSKNSHSNTL